jgi:methyl-accepting chemotaxis protein
LTTPAKSPRAATTAGTGRSTLGDTTKATEQALGQALQALGGAPPTYGFLFASPKHDVAAALASASRLAPGAAFVASTTAGEITQRGLTRGGMAVLLVSAPETTVVTRATTGVKADPRAAARTLCDGFEAAAKAAAQQGRPASTTVVLADGLNGVGEELVNQILSATRPLQQVVGGAAGDDGAFKATTVGAGAESHTDGAAVLHAFSPRPWGVGVDHGLDPTTKRMRVTRASGNVVHQLDGRPAFEVYREYAASKGIKLEAASAGPFLVGNELGIYTFDEVKRARAPLSVGADGSLSCAAGIPQGAEVAILDGQPDKMVSAARRAAEEAQRNLGGAPAAAVLLFDCVCRGMILDAQFGREIDAVRAVFPDVPIAGLLTYGEIARFKGRLDGWHNTTAVVAAIPA